MYLNKFLPLSIVSLLALFLIGLSHQSYSQQVQADPFNEHLFPPELIMKHQGAIQLSEDQRNDIVVAVSKSQQGFTHLQWELQRKMEAFQELIKQEKPDEEQVQDHLMTVLKTENHIKILQIQMMVQIKNILTGEQQEKLRQLRRR